MSASPPPTTAAHPQKRPLEEPSSPSGPGDQPDAKRQALDKIAKDEPPSGLPEPVQAAADNLDTNAAEHKSEDVGEGAQQNGVKDGQGDTVVPDAPAAHAVLETQPIQSTSSNSARNGSGAAGHQDETGWLHVRAIISSAEAATVIGKGGENVTLIRRMSGAKCTVSDYSRGAVERILTVSGLVDAVAKVSVHRIFILARN